MGTRPQARRDGVIAERRENGAVLYDIDALRVHRLDAVAARVWSEADGCRSTVALAAAAKVAEPSVAAALARLGAEGLLVGSPASAYAERRAAVLAAWQ